MFCFNEVSSKYSLEKIENNFRYCIHMAITYKIWEVKNINIFRHSAVAQFFSIKR